VICLMTLITIYLNRFNPKSKQHIFIVYNLLLIKNQIKIDL
jgi:hypothetical protein